MTTTRTVAWRAFALALASSHLLLADTVETKDGSRFVGKVIGINAGVVTLDSASAGKITIKQSDVTALSTDSPVAVRLESGSRIDGTISTQNGAVQVAGRDGNLATTVPKLSQSWPVGSLDPAAAHWTYEATVDINGTSGNTNQLGTDAGFTAKRISLQDELDFYGAYNRQVSSGVVSADQFKAGIDYSNNLTSTTSWFVRDEAGFDRVLGIKFYETAAAGFGEALFKNNVDLLTARVGIAYRYDSYSSFPAIPNVSSAAADFEINHDLKTANWEVSNKLVILPAFSDFHNILASQDSFFQIPLQDPRWKLRLGVSNNYLSQPPPGLKKLDTTYYTRLILDWGQ